MHVLYDDLWFCVDCTIAACNGDFSGLDYYYGDAADTRQSEIVDGLAAWGPHLVPDFDSNEAEGILEFVRGSCDCCNSPLAGSRHRFAVLGE